MALSVQVTRELRKELASLEASRAAVDAKIRALHSVLADGRRSAASELLTHVTSSEPAKRESARFRRTPLRATVLAALHRLSQGTAADVLANLQARGIKVGGSTTLRERVSHELSRLRRKGVVRRAANGCYEIAPSGPVNGFNSSQVDDVADDSVTVNLSLAD